MATDRQKQWRNRGQLLWRLKGFNLRYFMRDAPMTPLERDLLIHAVSNIESVIQYYSSNSKQLGFNVKERKE